VSGPSAAHNAPRTSLSSAPAARRRRVPPREPDGDPSVTDPPYADQYDTSTIRVRVRQMRAYPALTGKRVDAVQPSPALYAAVRAVTLLTLCHTSCTEACQNRTPRR